MYDQSVLNNTSKRGNVANDIWRICWKMCAYFFKFAEWVLSSQQKVIQYRSQLTDRQWTGDKSLGEPIMSQFPDAICITKPPCVEKK